MRLDEDSWTLVRYRPGEQLRDRVWRDEDLWTLVRHRPGDQLRDRVRRSTRNIIWNQIRRQVLLSVWSNTINVRWQ